MFALSLIYLIFASILFQQASNVFCITNLKYWDSDSSFGILSQLLGKLKDLERLFSKEPFFPRTENNFLFKFPPVSTTMIII